MKIKLILFLIACHLSLIIPVNAAFDGPGSEYAITVTNPTTSGTVAAGKHHIEFILSSNFAGTIGGVTISGATLAIYSPGDAPVGRTLGSLVYTITAGNAILTTW